MDGSRSRHTACGLLGGREASLARRIGVATRGALPRLRGRGEQGDIVTCNLPVPALCVVPIVKFEIDDPAQIKRAGLRRWAMPTRFAKRYRSPIGPARERKRPERYTSRVALLTTASQARQRSRGVAFTPPSPAPPHSRMLSPLTGYRKDH
jgi:hypothetical protein